MPSEPMQTYTVQQKMEVWYETTVQARNRYEAIEIMNGSGDWKCLHETMEETDTYWVENLDTHVVHELIDGRWITDGEEEI